MNKMTNSFADFNAWIYYVCFMWSGDKIYQLLSGEDACSYYSGLLIRKCLLFGHIAIGNRNYPGNILMFPKTFSVITAYSIYRYIIFNIHVSYSCIILY